MKPEALRIRLDALEIFALKNQLLLQRLLTEQFATQQLVCEMMMTCEKTDEDNIRKRLSIARLEASEAVERVLAELSEAADEYRALRRGAQRPKASEN